MYKFPSARRIFAVVLFCIFGLAGCTTAPKQQYLPSVADRLVAKDFSQILAQVPEYYPPSSTLRMVRPLGFNDTFDTALREGLAATGYTIEFLDFKLVSPHPILSHQVEKTQSLNGDVWVYTVTIDQVSFRRGYEFDDRGNIRPVTTMQAKGIELSRLRQDDSIFDIPLEIANAERQPSVEFQASASATPGLQVQQVTTNNNIQAAELVIEEPDELRDPIAEELIVIPPVVDASAEVEQTASKDMTDLQIVDESLLTFDDSSLVLGDVNKRQVRQFIANFNPRSDVFSVFGCSSDLVGPDVVEPRAIGLGRAERVRSELLYAGVPSNRIYTEGCGTEDSTAEQPLVPPRAVLLTLKRRSS